MVRILQIQDIIIYIPLIENEENRDMENENVRKKLALKPWHGVVWFVIVMVIMFFGGSIVQYYLGMLGLAITEIALAVLGLLPLLLFDVRLKDMLPVKVPKVRHVFGAILMLIAVYLLAIFATLIIGFFFPKNMAQTSGELGGFMTSVPPVLSFFIIAVMPAICEEILHRGFILTSMRSIRKDWLIVLIMGLIFGLFHMDPIRFAATAILGAGLSYVMVKTKNILLPCLMHLLVNSFSVLVTFLTQGTAQSVSSVSPDIVQSQLSSAKFAGAFLIFGAGIPLLLFAAVRLLTKEDKNAGETEGPKAPKKPFLVPFLISLGTGAVMLVSGILILVFSIMSDSIYIMKPVLTINDDTKPYVETFTVEKDKVYSMTYSLESDIGVIEMTIEDQDGNVLYDVDAAKITGNNQITLKEGTYTATFRFLIGEYEAYAKSKNYPFDNEVKADLHLDGDLEADHTAAITLVLT